AGAVGRRLGRNLPRTPDALPFIEAAIEDVVLADVLLLPVARAVFQLVGPIDDELADPITACAGDGAVGEVQLHLHQMPAGDQLLQEKAGPGAGWETWIGFDGLFGCRAHDSPPAPL